MSTTLVEGPEPAFTTLLLRPVARFQSQDPGTSVMTIWLPLVTKQRQDPHPVFPISGSTPVMVIVSWTAVTVSVASRFSVCVCPLTVSNWEKLNWYVPPEPKPVKPAVNRSGFRTLVKLSPSESAMFNTE